MSTMELKAVVTVETRAEAQIARLEKRIQGLLGRSNKAFAAPLDDAVSRTKNVEKAFQRLGGGMRDFGENQKRWANDLARQGKLTAKTYQDMEARLQGMFKKSGDIKAQFEKQPRAFLDLRRQMAAFSYVWNRHHGIYMKNLEQQGALQDRIADKRLYLAQRNQQAEEKMQRMSFSVANSLDRQRSAAYAAEEKRRNKIKHNSWALEMRQDNAQRAREARNDAAEERRKANLKRNSWALQMRQDEAGRKAQERAETAESKRQMRLKLNSWAMEDRQKAAETRAVRQTRARGQRNLMQGIGGLRDSAVNASHRMQAPGVYGAIAGGIVGAAAQRALGSHMRVDTQETNLKIFGLDHQKADGSMKTPAELNAEVRATRKGWLDREAMKNGLGPAAGLEAYTEVIKAGISNPEENTKTLLGAGAGMDMNLKETTRVMARIYSNLGSKGTPERLKAIMNAMAVSAKVTAADPDEIVAGMDRGLSVLTTGTMSPEDLSAFVATGRSVGIQQGKTGSFMSALSKNISEGGFARGQRAEDLNTAARMLGFGSGRSMARRGATDTTDTIMQILERLEGMDEQKRSKATFLLSGRQWGDEDLQLLAGMETLKKALAAVHDPKQAGHLDEAREMRLSSMRGVNTKARAVMAMAWDALGAGIEDTYRELVDFFIDIGSNLDFDVVKAHVNSFFNGLIDGLGFKNFTELLRKAFGGMGNNQQYIDTIFRFAQGFGKGMVAVYETVQKLLGMVPGGDVTAEGIGELTAKLIGLGLGLKAAGPAFDMMGLVKDGLMGLAAGVIALNGALALLGLGSIKGMGAKALGGLGVRAFGGMAGAAGSAAIGSAAGALGVGASLTAALTGLAILGGVALVGTALAVAIMNWDAIKDWFKTATSSGAKPEEMSPIEKPKADLQWWEVDPLFHRQSFEGGNDFTSMISPASFTSDGRGSDETMGGIDHLSSIDRNMGILVAMLSQKHYLDGVKTKSLSRLASNPGDTEVGARFQNAAYNPGGTVQESMERLGRNVDRMGSRFQLASLTGASMGASALALGGGVGGGAGAGGSLPPGTPGDPAKQFGRNFFTPPGMSPPSWYGKGSGGLPDPGGSAGAGPYKATLDYIAQAEGTAGKGDYNTSLGYGKFLPGGQEQKLTDKSLNEILQLGDYMRKQPGNPNSSALGRYQIVGQTLRGLMTKLGLSGNEKFDEAMQDRLAAELVRQRGANARGLGQEWASLKGAKGSVAAGLVAQIPNGASTIPGARETPGGAAGAAATIPGKAAQAADVAKTFEGLDEDRDTAKLEGFMKRKIQGSQNAWCAAFVNSSLKAVGLKGSGSDMANSFLGWGKGIDNKDVEKGDVLVEHRNKGLNAKGGHVGLATGNRRVVDGKEQLEWTAGNSDNGVKTEWVDADAVKARRSTEAGAAAQTAAAAAGRGQYDGLRIKGGQAIGGGAAALGVTDLARQAQDSLPGGVKHFAAFNDHFHAGSNSKHASGLAFDTSLIDPRQSGAAAEAMREKMRAAGLSDEAFKVIDEYKNPSSRSTGGHIHTQFNSKEAAEKYHKYIESLRQQAETAAQATSPAAPAAAPASGGASAVGGKAAAIAAGAGQSNAERMIQNVPPPAVGLQGAGTRAGGGGAGAGTNMQIIQHINGAGKNPKELAGDVQRHLTEAWNSRGHDMEPELA